MGIFSLCARRLVGLAKVQKESLFVSAQIHLEQNVSFLHGLQQIERENLASTVVRGVAVVKMERVCSLNEINLTLSGSFYETDLVAIRSAKLEEEMSFPGTTKQFMNCKHILFDNSSSKPILFYPEVVYRFPFEFVIDCNYPESIRTLYGSIVYEMALAVNCPEETPFRNFDNIFVLDSQEIILLRALSPLSSSHGDTIVVQGIWREMIRYSFGTYAKTAQINKNMNFNVKLEPIMGANCYQICTLKFFLVQNISFFWDEHRRTVANTTRPVFSQNQKIPLGEVHCKQDDLDNDGAFIRDFSFPILEVMKKEGSLCRLLPYTCYDGFQIPNLKVTHTVKMCVILQKQRNTLASYFQQNQPNFQAQPFGDNGSISPIFSSFFDQFSGRDSSLQREIAKQAKTVELSITAPIYLLHQDSICETPPNYKDMAFAGCVTANQNWFTSETDLKEDSYNSWFNLVGRQLAERPPAYYEPQVKADDQLFGSCFCN